MEKEDLNTVMRERRVEGCFGNRGDRFLPQGQLEHLLTRRSILAEMDIKEEEVKEEDEALVAFVIQRAKKLFAILVSIRLPRLQDAMTLFSEHDFDDSKLPIDLWTVAMFTESQNNGQQHPFFAMQGNIERKRDIIWSKASIYDFQDKQWEFLAPVLSREDLDQYYSNEVIMPFIAPHAHSAEGSFGVVSKYEVHQDYISTTVQDPQRRRQSSNVVAVKEIKNGSKRNGPTVAEHWAKEIQALSQLNNLQHEHILRLITAFRYGSRNDPAHFLVLEWPTGGNLHDLWVAKPQPHRSLPAIKAVLHQLQGLTSALEAVHNLSSTTSLSHGDLKPANILYFLSDAEFGTWKLGDWGEALSENVGTKWHDRSRHSDSSTRFATRRYEPPEKALLLTANSLPRPTARAADMWAMGCIILELTIWLLYGSDGLEQFNDEFKKSDTGSPFYQVAESPVRTTVRVHETTERWLERMSSEVAYQPDILVIDDILKIIRTGLLVVEPQTENDLHQLEDRSQAKPPMHRSNASKLAVQLKHITMSLDYDLNATTYVDSDGLSTFSSGTSVVDRKYKSELAEFLATSPRLHPWCRQLLLLKGEKQFVDIVHNLLEGFHQDLLEEVKSDRQALVVGLLRSSKGRYRMGREMTKVLSQDAIKGLHQEDSDDEAERERGANRVLEQLSMGQDKVQAWTPELPEGQGLIFPDLPLDQGQGPEGHAIEDPIREDDASSASSDDPNLKDIDELKNFLHESEAFKGLLAAFQLSFLSKDVQFVLQSTPRDKIKLSAEQNRSYVNLTKVAIEDFTRARWNWWPLQPCMRELRGDQERLFWLCACNTWRWKEVTLLQAKIIHNLFPESPSQPTKLHLCRDTSGNPTFTEFIRSLAGITQPKPTAQLSDRSTGQNPVSTPPGALQGTSQSGSKKNFPGGPPGSQQSGPAIGNQQSTGANMHGTLFPMSRVIFGVQGARRPVVEIDQIKIDHQMTDMSFYSELKRRYRIKRGFIRFWFSIWRLEYCDFVQFKRSWSQQIIRSSAGLPQHGHADYLERVPKPDEFSPPIPEHEFNVHLRACNGSCTWALFHTCSPPTSKTTHLKCIPQKKTEFDLSTNEDEAATAWGLEAGLTISAAYVAIYHVLILALPFGFWGWWLKAHPDDLQNASVPVTVVLTMLSLFWGANGIFAHGVFSKEKIG